jgi:hypothetical protein
MAHIAGGGETQKPATKRARLESVIPVRTTPLPAAKAAQPAAPPTPKPVLPPSWLSGQLLANQRGNTRPRGQQRVGRGSHNTRGGQSGPVGTAPPGAETGAGPEAAARAAGAAGESPPR